MIFVWWSDALKRYSSGHVLIEAETVEEAREKAPRLFIEHLERERREYWEPRQAPDMDEDDIEDRERVVTQFHADIAAPPREISDACFILGSE